MVILDSDIVVGLLRNDEAARKKVVALEQSGPVFTTAITVFELTKGAQRYSNPQAATARMQDALRSMHVLEFDAHAASIAGTIAAMQQKAGAHSGTLDIFIASICIAQGHSIVTRNHKHFARIDGLRIESW